MSAITVRHSKLLRTIEERLSRIEVRIDSLLNGLTARRTLRRPRFAARLLELFPPPPAILTVRALVRCADAWGVSENATRQLLVRLRDAGKIERVGYGLYRRVT